jgi:hypothetical protein
MSEDDLGLTVFKTSHQMVLDAWDKMKITADAHHDACRALVVDLGFPQDHGMYTKNNHPGRRIVGFAIPDGGIPPGWRKERNYSEIMVPHLSTKMGKDIAAKINAVGVRPDSGSVVVDFGMPSQAFVGLNLLLPGVTRQGDTVWVKWSLDPRNSRGNGNNGLDLTIWEHVPLSVFIKMIEDGNNPWKGES